MKRIIILALLFVVACGAQPIVTDDSQSTEQDVQAIVAANNQFAFELLPVLDGENIFFSPSSLSTAMAMVYEGAREETATEIQDVFHYPERTRYGYARLHNVLNKKDKDYALHAANALWAHQDYPFLDSYLQLGVQYYGNSLENLDFNNPEEVRNTINDWVEDQTNDKIKDLFPPGSLNSLTRLVITNAVYFKGDWVIQFKKRDTSEQPFLKPDGSSVTVPLMSLHGEKARFNYAEGEGMQVVELPYEGEEVSMLVFLPNETVEPVLDVTTYETLTKQMHKEEMRLFLPKFKLETKYDDVKETLSGMGMPTAFSMEADLSGMDGTNNLYVQQVIHQAFVDVNEKGTEAAAATGISVMAKALPSYRLFRADHPFIFVIRENETGAILFMGKIRSPTS